MSEELKAGVEQTEQAEAVEVSQEESMADVTVLKKGDTVKGKIVKVEADQVIVDVGYKYDGVIPIRELSNVNVEDTSGAVEIGQEVELKVITIDDNKEKLVLSKRAVDSSKAWDQLAADMENRTILEAKVAEVVKGGLVVDVGLRGFVPASMVERTFVEDFSDYKGRTLRLRVKEMDREKNKVILSQKDVLDEEFEAKKREVLAGIQPGQELTGTVQRLTPFGVFVDIGGVDGLVHISELAWHHVETASEIVKEGDEVKVKVLKVDPANERISLSIKATEPGPWEKVKGEIQIGDIVTGTVKRLVQFGAFVEVYPGVEGLVHVSQIAHHHVATPFEVLKEGQEVKVKVLDMNTDEKRISLSIKETEEAPPREARADKPRAPKKDSVVLEEAQSLNLTLGERFGDKLSKFK